MRRFLLIFLATFVAMLVLLVGVAAWLVHDEVFLKDQVYKYALQYTGRELLVDGKLDVSLGTVIRLEATEIRFANADWAENPEMVTVGQLIAAVKTFSLLGGQPVIPIIQVSDCRLELLETVDNGANWDLIAADEAEEDPDTRGLPVDLQHLDINRCVFSYVSEIDEQTHELSVQRFRQTLRNDNNWKTRVPPY